MDPIILIDASATIWAAAVLGVAALAGIFSNL